MDERPSFRSGGGHVGSMTRPPKPEEERTSWKVGRGESIKTISKQSSVVEKAMALLGERYASDVFKNRAREKFGADQANNSAIIRHADGDSIMVVELDSETNKSLELCDRMLDIDHTKRGCKNPEYFEQETKDSGEAGFQLKYDIGGGQSERG